VDNVIEDLNTSESEILYLLKIVDETVLELSKCPFSDQVKLKTMSEAYLMLVQRINAKVKKSSRLLDSYSNDISDIQRNISPK